MNTLTSMGNDMAMGAVFGFTVLGERGHGSHRFVVSESQRQLQRQFSRSFISFSHQHGIDV